MSEELSKKVTKQEALDYHSQGRPGKIEVVPTKPCYTQKDLSLAYSPGVADPCLEIEKDPSKVFDYTAKGNLVAVLSNGTAVLGLGNIGALAGKPVMEGKGVLFKRFADVDVYDIEVNSTNPDEVIKVAQLLEPTFGGINLEDIKAPECFKIEKILKEELDIPVMHDDQHGTAIISAAALINATEIVGKKLNKIKVVVSGAGAAAVSCTKLYKKIGVKAENIVMVDSKGVIRADRDNLSTSKKEFATKRNLHTLKDAIKNADMFLGLSVADILTPDMLLTMAKNPIVFALANPNPEIEYKLAIKTRKDILMATGRSDYPNQVNNVLGFPYIFRGALDVRATAINEEMKIAAVYALAALAKESVPEQVNITYKEKHLEFGKDYIIPKPFDLRLMEVIPVAVAKAAVASGVAKEPIENWEKYAEELSERLGSGSKWMKKITTRAKRNPKKIVFAEADHLDVLKAAQIVYDEGIANPILLGDKETIETLMEEINFEVNTDEVLIIDPKDNEQKERRLNFAQMYWEKRQRRGIKLLDAQKLMRERNYFAAMMVNSGEADSLVSGYSRSYPTVVKPMLELIGRKKGVKKIAATNLMLTSRGPMFFSDTAINETPTAEELVDITTLTAEAMQMFGIRPKIAMLSFSNFGSSDAPQATKMKDAVNILHEKFPDLEVDGEVQADFALNQRLMQEKFPFSQISTKKVNALIFPNLSAANISYKLMKELSNIDSVGPIIMGLKKPVHILQLGASVDEIVNMTTIAVVDAQTHERQNK
jgi:malate dehydrogenase (oxaloacetate-decarboxylating)(NADP+)